MSAMGNLRVPQGRNNRHIPLFHKQTSDCCHERKENLKYTRHEEEQKQVLITKSQSQGFI